MNTKNGENVTKMKEGDGGTRNLLLRNFSALDYVSPIGDISNKKLCDKHFFVLPFMLI